MTARVLRPGEIIYAGEVRPSSSVVAGGSSISQNQQSLQMGSSVLANRHYDVSKFEKALQDKHQSMQMPSGLPMEYTYEDKGRYSGTMISGKRQGFGQYHFPNGDYYKGLWVADAMSGLGYYRYSSSQRAYYGEFLNSKNHGHGALTVEQNPPIVIYDGQWVDGLKHGKGVYVYSYEPLEYYEGAWELGQKSGLGKYFKDGSEYYGEWSANKRNGQGTYVTKDGSRYNGRWKNDQLEEAVISYPKGTGSDEYRGDVSRGLRNGKGTYTYSDGGRYEGDYRDDLRHGRGKEVAGSAIYQGEFLNDKKHGRGVYRFSNGDVYEGDFDEGRKHGANCSYTWGDHSTFAGSFQNDKMWEGVYTDSSDKIARRVISGNVI